MLSRLRPQLTAPPSWVAFYPFAPKRAAGREAATNGGHDGGASGRTAEGAAGARWGGWVVNNLGAEEIACEVRDTATGLAWNGTVAARGWVRVQPHAAGQPAISEGVRD